MVTVRFYSLLRRLLQRESMVLSVTDGDTVATMLQKIGGHDGAAIAEKLFADDGALQVGVIILVNRHNIYHLQGLATPVKNGDELALFPAAAGG